MDATQASSETLASRIRSSLNTLATALLLSAAPVAAMAGDELESREDRRARLMEQFDSDGDGELSPEERGAAREQRSQRRLERFDGDGDGRLSPQERERARAERPDKRRGHQGSGPSGGDSGHGGRGQGRGGRGSGGR